MRTSSIPFVALILVGLSVIAEAQSRRRDDFTPANVTITSTQLDALADGGCVVRWCGEIASDDGGARLRACTDGVELKNGPNRARCGALIAAGESRVLREMRFAVDGGVP